MASKVTGPREAQAAVVALRSVDRQVRSDINRQTRAVVNPAWQGAVSDRLVTKMDGLVLGKGVRVSTGATPTLVGASSGRALSGGLVPNQSWKGWEFGASRNEKTTYTARSKNGKTFKVTRRTKRQLPNMKKGGRVLFPAAAEMGPRIAALWTQTTIWRIIEALEKGE